LPIPRQSYFFASGGAGIFGGCERLGGMVKGRLAHSRPDRPHRWAGGTGFPARKAKEFNWSDRWRPEI